MSDFYKNFWEHYAEEFECLESRINILMEKQKLIKAAGLNNRFKGMVITEEEVYGLMGRYGDNGITPEILKLEVCLEEEEALINKKCRVSEENGISLPLIAIQRLMALGGFEKHCIFTCLASEIESKYLKIYGYLNDDINLKNPTIGLLLSLFCHTVEERYSALDVLCRGNFVKILFRNSENSDKGSILTRTIRLEESVVNFLIGLGDFDTQLEGYCDYFTPDAEIPPLLTGKAEYCKIYSYMELLHANKFDCSVKHVLFVYGAEGSGRKLNILHACKQLRKKLIIANLRKISESSSFNSILTGIIRNAILNDAALCFSESEILFKDSNTAEVNAQNIKDNTTQNKLLDELSRFKGLVLLLSRTPWNGIRRKDISILSIALNIPENSERKLLWEHYRSSVTFEKSIDWGSMAGKFRFTPGQIKEAIKHAGKITGNNCAISSEELHTACYLQVQHNLEKKAQKVTPVYTWDDIVLPEDIISQLTDACNQVKYRHIVYGEWGFDRKLAYGKGLSMMFAGPPGTGKTMSAQIIAKELELELYKIDLAQIISKYIGETEQNLKQIFEEAQASNAILFFDEADALFGKRSDVKDSHDRYANIETAYLLQRVEEYEGVTILATNLAKNLDDAFLRRINFIIEFPFPDTVYREKILRGMFPNETPLGDDIDFPYIAQKFDLAGGSLKNIVVAAAYMAAAASEAVGMKHIIRAARYEMLKAGKIMPNLDV